MSKSVNYLNLSIAVAIIAFLFFFAIQLVGAGLIFLSGGIGARKEHFWNDMVDAVGGAIHDHVVRPTQQVFDDPKKAVRQTFFLARDATLSAVDLFLQIPDEAARRSVSACQGVPDARLRASCQIVALAYVCKWARGSRALSDITLARGATAYTVCTQAAATAKEHGVLSWNAAENLWRN